MSKRLRSGIFLTVILPWCLIFSTPATATETTVYETDSAYHHIRVVQDRSIRGLKFDNNYFQSKVDINNPLLGHFSYIELFFESFLFTDNPENMLILGLGGGSAPRLINHFQPNLKMTTVELDPEVVDIAQQYFFFDADKMPVTVSDARTFLRRSDKQYDIIIQDTYSSSRYGTFIPFHLATLEYFQLVRDHLTDDGAFAINVIGTVYGGEPNRVITSVYRTMHQVFPQMYMFGANDVQNVVIVATKDNVRKTGVQLTAWARELEKRNPGMYPDNFIKATESQFYDTLPSRLSDAIILTDDYAPTDNLLR
jgi:spermidine synthase